MPLETKAAFLANARLRGARGCVNPRATPRASPSRRGITHVAATWPAGAAGQDGGDGRAGPVPGGPSGHTSR